VVRYILCGISNFKSPPDRHYVGIGQEARNFNLELRSFESEKNMCQITLVPMAANLDMFAWVEIRRLGLVIFFKNNFDFRPTQAQMKDMEKEANKMYSCNTDISSHCFRVFNLRPSIASVASSARFAIIS